MRRVPAGHGPADVLVAVAPAKVNLALAVTGRRLDGFHVLRSVFLRLVLGDGLSVSLAPPGTTRDALVVVGDPDCPVEGNLVLRAAELLRGEVGRDLPALAFRLRKRIPMGAGLAGGSSDGAAALDLASAAWGLRLHPAERLESALRLGADVPFFAAGHACALVGGIGEGLQPLAPPRRPVGLLLVTPAERLSTAEVFGALDDGPAPAGTAGTAVDGLVTALRSGLDGAGLAAQATGLREANDLWPAALALLPSLGPLQRALEDELGRPALMTGSGSTLFCLLPSLTAARAAARRLRAAALPALRGCRIIVTASAPPEEDRP